MNETILMVDPSEILARQNSRFGLIPFRLEDLKQSILDVGEITEPVEVTPITGAKKGEPKYDLVKGFYRHQAAVELNRDQNVGVLIPIRLHDEMDEKTRLHRQLIENMKRANQSPMDMAVAIDQLLKAGVERAEIRRLFSRPSKQKGQTIQPASNAWVNIIHRLLELPASIQAKVHNGDVGFDAAYELGKVSPDKRKAVLERAEALAEAQRTREERDEDAFLKQASKHEEAAAAVKTAATELEQARADQEAAQAAVLDKKAAYDEAKVMKFDLTDKEEMRKAVEKVKATETDFKAAEKALLAASKKIDRLNGIVETKSDKAAQLKKALEAKRKKTPKAKVTGKDIKAAAAGAENKPVPLNAADMREVINDLASGEHAVPRVTEIGKIIKAAFDGIDTPKQMFKKLTDHIMGAAKK